MSISAMQMETEIRKLKIALMQQELDDKLLTFRAYMESQQNITTTTEEPIIEEKHFGSILFAKVVGDFEVLHFVILIFLAWFLLIIIISYSMKLYNCIRRKYFLKSMNKKRNRNFRRLEEKGIEFDVTKTSSTQLPKEKRESILISTLSYPKIENHETNENFEFDYKPPKGDFFLYTIHEHQMLTKKTFGYKKKLYNTLLSKNLSKSDSNISTSPCRSIDNKGFDV